jgi:hypothetical protein
LFNNLAKPSTDAAFAELKSNVETWLKKTL